MSDNRPTPAERRKMAELCRQDALRLRNRLCNMNEKFSIPDWPEFNTVLGSIESSMKFTLVSYPKED